MPVPTTEMVTPLRASSVVSVASPKVRAGVGVTALPRTMPLIDAPADADEGPTDDSEPFPPHAAATRATTMTSTAVPPVERRRSIQFLREGGGEVGNSHTGARCCGSGENRPKFDGRRQTCCVLRKFRE